MATMLNMSMKLLIDSKGERVLFAEAGKDDVDFLFNIVSLPMGTIVRILTKQSMVGCLGNIYRSIENIDETYILPNHNKNTFLKTTLPNHLTNVPLLLNNSSSESIFQFQAKRPASQTPTRLYRCSTGRNFGYIAADPSARCPSHHDNAMNVEMRMQLVEYPPANLGFSKSLNKERGFVKEWLTYMIMDDLVVTPVSTISSITCLLNELNIKDMSC